MPAPTLIDLLILGAGAFGREVAEYARALPGRCRVKGLLDDDARLTGRSIDGARVWGTTHEYVYAPTDRFIVAVGDPAARRALAERARARGGEPFLLIHPTAYVSPTAVFDQGVVVGPFAFVGPAATLGPHACLNTHASVGHDASIGEYAVLSPYAAVLGAATIEAGVFMGARATVLPGAHVGEGAQIAAGAVVTTHVPAAALAAGNPATSRVVSRGWIR